MQIIGLFFAFLKASTICTIPVCKNKKNICVCQIYKTIFGILSNFFLGAYTGMISTAISLIRNCLAVRNKINFKSQIILSLSLLVTGLYFNNQGIIGILPIIAFIQYTFIALNPKASILTMKCSFMIDVFLWLIHDIHIGSYPTIVANIISLILGIISIIKIINENHNARKATLYVYYNKDENLKILVSAFCVTEALKKARKYKKDTNMMGEFNIIKYDDNTHFDSDYIVC